MSSAPKSFRCVGSDGRIYWVQHVADRCDLRSQAPSAAFDSLRTSDGRPVAYVAKGRYQLDRPPVDLACDDPDAP